VTESLKEVIGSKQLIAKANLIRQYKGVSVQKVIKPDI